MATKSVQSAAGGPDAVDEALRDYGAVLCNGRMPGGRADGPHYRPLDKRWDPLGAPVPRSYIRVRPRPMTWPGEDIVYSVADPTPTIIRDQRPEGWGVDQDTDLYGAWRQWRVAVKVAAERIASIEPERMKREADTAWVAAHPDLVAAGIEFDRFYRRTILAELADVERRLVSDDVGEVEVYEVVRDRSTNAILHVRPYIRTARVEPGDR